MEEIIPLSFSSYSSKAPNEIFEEKKAELETKEDSTREDKHRKRLKRKRGIRKHLRSKLISQKSAHSNLPLKFIQKLEAKKEETAKDKANKKRKEKEPRTKSEQLFNMEIGKTGKSRNTTNQIKQFSSSEKGQGQRQRQGRKEFSSAKVFNTIQVIFYYYSYF